MRIGFIGLGNMGANMALVLAKAGRQLTVHDIDRERAAALEEAGAQWADTPKACAQGADILITSLPRPQTVEAVMLGEAGALAGLGEGAIWVDTTTNDVDVVERIAALAA